MAAAGIAFLTAFFGATVESVEALTVILAVGLARGWRSALQGAAVGLVILVAVVATIGEVALSRVPEAALEVAIGVLILLFGVRWLRKAVLRAAGVLELHDEARAYERTQRRLAGGSGSDGIGFAISLNAVLLEGTEVAFIVVAAGAGGRSLGVAALGGALGVLLVAAAGFAVRGPLTRVPENTLKYAIGVALSALGTFWVLEGMGVRWPLDIGSVLPLAAIYLAASQLAVLACRTFRPNLAETG